MQQKITTSLWFDNEAEEAARFYTSTFKDSKVLGLTRYGKGMPKPEGSVLTVTFQLAGQEFVGLNGGPEFKFNEAISLIVNCDNQEEVDRLWAQFTADGGEPGPCGWLKDKYGLSWQIVPVAATKMFEDPDKAKSQRVMDALLKMSKINLAELERAYAGG